MSALNRDTAMAALATVKEPDLKKDLVTLGMIKKVEVEGGLVDVTVELTTPACPMKELIARDIRIALGRIEGFERAEIEFTANVQGRPAQGAQGSPAPGQAPQAQPPAPLAPGVRNIIAVGSGKGGVGKSTTAVNIAIALAQTGARVGLLDADIYGPNVPTMLGLDDRPPVIDQKMVPIEKFSLKIISMGLIVPKDQAVIWRGPMLNSAVRQFFGDVHWGELDYLIVDLPPGTGDVQISLVQIVPLTGAVIVTTPQTVSTEDCVRAISMLNQTNTPVLGVVENMSFFQPEPPDGRKYYLFGKDGGRATAEALGVPFLGAIPLGENVREGGDAGKPVVVADPDCEQSRIYREIAANLAQQVSILNHASAETGGLEINLQE